MERQEVMRLISEKLFAADLALAEAKTIADEHDVSFYWSGPTYGMGGRYAPNITAEERDWGDEEGWQASSQSGC